jgi:ATP-binding cassette subfamily C protein CydD
VKPLDPRLLRHARAARGYVLLTAGLGLATAATVIAQAWLLGGIAAPVVVGDAAIGDVRHLVGWLALVLALRAVLVATQERYAHRAATRVIAELRRAVLEHALELGPRWLDEGRRTSVVTLATRGLDSLEPYFVRYLPQLLLAVTVTPVVLVVIAGLDLVAALTIAVTIPLIPLFMVLVGQLTQRYAAERLASLQRLGGQVLDLLAGLGTLKALGREQGPAARVRELGDAYRATTMQTLRVAFLSGAVLELLATLAVALVAVGVGLRLVFGELDLTTGLIVLVLAPEVYLPLRQVGTHFHASADGVAAAEAAFAVLDEPLPARGSRPAPDLRTTPITWEAVSVRTPGRDGWAPFELTATVLPGRTLALVGPNGAGKSTAAAVLLGLVAPDRGSVVLGSPAAPGQRGTPGDAGRPTTAGSSEAGDGRTPLGDLDPQTWWAQIAWVPQRPAILPGTVRENLRAEPGNGDATGSLARAAALTGLDVVVAALPQGWDTRIGHGGAGLSLGERQRLALTRALLDDAPLVVLDEPTAHLDAASEAQVIDTIRELRSQGRTVVVVAHRQAVLDAVDVRVPVRSARGDAGELAEPAADTVVTTSPGGSA